MKKSKDGIIRKSKGLAGIIENSIVLRNVAIENNFLTIYKSCKTK
ncbi:hypothetical protein ACFOWA_05630 [Pedobacter lithocola]|uniref:Uncharacterized protein n=1 Tax=Pedobacter lithocola TaxID=1908239 RepID=A0ABV8P5T6_9SPHI